MDFLQKLGSHRGGLLLLKTELFWYGGRGWDGVHDRVCLLLNTAAVPTATAAAVAATAARATGVVRDGDAEAVALLLVDGAPHWIWVAQSGVKLLS